MGIWAYIGFGGLFTILGFFVYFAFISDRGKTFLWQGIPYVSIPDSKRLEILNYDQNHEHKIALVVSDPAVKLGDKYQTGYYYDPEDFHPSLNTIDWKHYAGTILGFRSLDGMRTSVPEVMHSLQQELRMAREDSKIDRHLKTQSIEQRKHDQSIDKQKEEVFHKAGTLEALNNLVKGSPEPTEKQEVNINQ